VFFLLILDHLFDFWGCKIWNVGGGKVWFFFFRF